LSATQLAALAELGDERTAEVGDVLYRIGDRRYPFIAIVEGEVAILDEVGNEIVRHGASGFLGELNLLSGQTVFVTAVVTQPLRYIAVDRDALRPLLFDDGPLSDLLLSSFIARRELLQGAQGVGMEVVGPRSSEATMQMLEFARSNRLPFTWRDPERGDDPPAAELVAGLDPSSLPVVGLPGGAERPASPRSLREASGRCCRAHRILTGRRRMSYQSGEDGRHMRTACSATLRARTKSRSTNLGAAACRANSSDQPGPRAA
jgi:thioredoxin reductase (NADPH)